MDAALSTAELTLSSSVSSSLGLGIYSSFVYTILESLTTLTFQEHKPSKAPPGSHFDRHNVLGSCKLKASLQALWKIKLVILLLKTSILILSWPYAYKKVVLLNYDILCEKGICSVL